MIKLPTFQSTAADFLFSATLEEKVHQLRFIYNIRNSSFAFYFIDGDGNTVNSVKVVPNFPLLKYRKSFTSLRGDFMVLNDSVPEETEITYENFGDGFGLYYLTASEVEEWEVSNGLQ